VTTSTPLATSAPSAPQAMGANGSPEGLAGSVSTGTSGEVNAPLPLGDIRLPVQNARGHWLVVHFAAGYCPTCDDDARNLDEIATVSHPQGVMTMVITMGDEAEWRAHAGSEVSVVEDPELAQQYAGKTALVDPEGHVRELSEQTPSAAEIERVVGSAARSPVDVSVATESDAIVVKLAIADGHHVMSATPTRPEYFGLRVSFPSKAGVHVGEPQYPRDGERAVSAGDVVNVYSGTVAVRVPYTVDQGAAGRVQLDGTVRYQACTDKDCQFPADAPVVAVVDAR
jgi:hypothetical protein